MNEKEKSNKNIFQHTLNLPQTDFALRANASIKEPEILGRWENENLYEKATQKNDGKKKFVLHDGPPYANGHLHMGHALTYILKDIVCKSKRMAGFYAPLVPGWDCHGLPIEFKVASELGVERSKESIDRVLFKKHCREYAKKWIEIQKSELKELGKIADYENAYITMNKQYESDILRALSIFVKNGHIERKEKTVPWCATCQTVLAAAEIEHKDRKDPSIYVEFPIEDNVAKMIFPYAFEMNPDLRVSFLVWTTTPWTLPLNRAVVLNPKAKYVIIRGKDANHGMIVGKDLAGKICSMLNLAKDELCEFDADVFEGKSATHPFIEGLQIPVLIDSMVTTEDGTACLHCAPGCGPEDYLLGVRSGLEIFSPLSADGKYSSGIKPGELEGMAVVDGQVWVIKKLFELDRLVHKESTAHSYPHCWRCHNGLMFRATKQWFCDLQKNDLVKKSLEEIEKIKFIPTWGKNRLSATVGSRTEWCISRQKIWGVPIPAILCNYCDTAFISSDFVSGISQNVAGYGIEYWDTVTLQDLKNQGFLPDNFCCPKCFQKDLANFRKERDILDVWFDSGISHFAVLARDIKRLGVPADIYFEGSDQHRGWFQSSLLCSMVINGHTATNGIITHGYVVDEDKKKMSKSVGNVVAPFDIIKKYSRDILRLWVASSDYEGDVVISEQLLSNLAEVYRKIRNTCRFLISNLYDFDISKDAVSFDNLFEIDKYALIKLAEVNSSARAAYDEYKFSSVVNILNNYCINDLSALYLDIVKDRLYVEHSDGKARRAAQTVIFNILDTLIRLLAPILSFLAEEVSDFYQKNKTESIHMQNFINMEIPYRLNVLEADMIELVQRTTKPECFARTDIVVWVQLEAVRDIVLRHIEALRVKNIVKHSLESKVFMFIDGSVQDCQNLNAFLSEIAQKDNLVRFFKEWFIVSQVDLTPSAKDLAKTDLEWFYVKVEHAVGTKCPRCWQWEQTTHQDGLCARCRDVLMF